MQHANLGGGGDVYFTYDASGNRVRKVWVHGNHVDERIYFGSFEIYREHTGGVLNGPVQLERETLHVFDDEARVAMVETKTADTTGSSGAIGASTWRFQLSNHLGSSALELTQSGGVISYEEYHPFGSTAFHSAQGSLGVSTMRYRYTGKERDEAKGCSALTGSVPAETLRQYLTARQITPRTRPASGIYPSTTYTY
jgi:hypothetical protein